MKTNFNIGDAIIVNKPGLKDLPGVVLSNNKKAAKPLCIILDNGAGTWQFTYEEVTASGKESVLKEPKIAKVKKNEKSII